jgi:aminopeptidase YwaD
MLRLIFIITLTSSITAQAQDMEYTKRIIKDLCSNELEGRGYVNDGVNKAADYLAKEFKSIGLKPIKRSYFQRYAFPVNTFPTPITCTLDDKELLVGRDFLLSPSSGNCNGTYYLRHFDLNDSIEKVLWEKTKETPNSNSNVYVLKNEPKDYVYSNTEIEIKSLDSKLMHSISNTSAQKCELIFHDSVINNTNKISIQAEHKQIERFECRNIIGYIPAKKKKNRNKYIVFTGHYDHLGRLGQAIFPGASDNASGISMLLNLAKYYTNRDNEYSIVFILFSGEEAGLIGSQYFTTYPTFNIKNIKALINLDIMGSAEEGVTVVNATEFPSLFDKLTQVNDKAKHLPFVKSRGKAANSDHYFFSEMGIPAFFLYSNGGPGFYHDVMDKPDTLPLTNYNGVYNLLIDFVEQL